MQINNMSVEENIASHVWKIVTLTKSWMKAYSAHFAKEIVPVQDV